MTDAPTGPGEISSNDQTRKYLLHDDLRLWLKEQAGLGDWITVYELSESQPPAERRSTYCALIPPEKLDACLGNHTWDLMLGHGMPGTISWMENGEWVSRYAPLGDDDGIRPFIFYRDHGSRCERYPELLQEFVLFHNLFFDRNRGVYLRHDEDGIERDVVKIEPRRVLVRNRELRQFLKLTECYFALYFDVFRFAPLRLSQYQLSADSHFEEREGLFNLSVTFQDSTWGEHTGCNSLLIGKKLISPPSRAPDESWPPSPERRYEDFIIGVNELGDPVHHSCEPDALADYFGKNPAAPHYLTPVHFRKEVLRRYYDAPETYELHDGSIHSKNGWIFRFDDHLPDRVTAYLGDLGRDITHREQLHWKAHNIPPSGPLISEVKFRRDFLAEFADPTKSDLVLKAELRIVEIAWLKKWNWPLYKALHEADQHHATSWHIPVSNEWPEFESQIISLTKIVIDSLNEAELARDIVVEEGDKGLAKLEKFLALKGVADAKALVRPLRNLQDVRSVCSAHRKGKRFDEVWRRQGFQGLSNPEVFEKLLLGVLQTVRQLHSFTEAG